MKSYLGMKLWALFLERIAGFKWSLYFFHHYRCQTAVLSNIYGGRALKLHELDFDGESFVLSKDYFASRDNNVRSVWL